MIVRETQPYSLVGQAVALRKSNGAPLAWREEDGWTMTLCARSALRAMLLYLRETGVLADKTAQILTPQWACTTLYQTFHKLCFPANRPNRDLSGVMIYHQYGFPQNMAAISERCREDGLFVIENSVNCFDSHWRNCKDVEQDLRIGSIFSFPKLFPVVLGGALQTDDARLGQFARDLAPGEATSRFARFWSYWARLLDDKGRYSIIGGPLVMNQALAYAISDYSQDMPATTKSILTVPAVKAWLDRRRDNYTRLYESLESTGAMDHLERGAIPYVAPLKVPDGKAEGIAAALDEEGFRIGIYHFDTNRNVFEPHFERMVLVPVHAGLGNDDMDRIAATVRSRL